MRKRMATPQTPDVFGTIQNYWGQIIAFLSLVVWGSRQGDRIKQLELLDAVKQAKIDTLDSKIDSIASDISAMKTNLEWLVRHEDNKK